MLTLALSLQASYAAPLILLAQDRQATGPDQSEIDRRAGARRPTPSSSHASGPACG